MLNLLACQKQGTLMGYQKDIRAGILTGNHYPRLGGVEYYNHFLAEALNQLPNVKVSIASGTLAEVPSDFPYPYSVYRAKSFWHLTPWLHYQNHKKMLQQEQLNILHGPMLHGGGVMALRLKQEFGLPMIAQSHGSDVQLVPEIEYGACSQPEIKTIVQQVINEADHIVAVSSLNKQQIVELGGIDRKITIIHNGIQYEEIQQITFTDQKEKYNLSQDDFVLITVGRNRPIKRMELLFQALAILGSKGAHIKCLCVGPEENLAELAESYGVMNQIRLTGRIPQIKKGIYAPPPYPELTNCYRSADLYVSCSYVESFGGAAADALATGTPIIVGRNHGITDVLVEGVTGWVMKDETPEELASILLSLSHRKVELKQHEHDISDSVRHLTWENIAKQMRDVYQNVLDNK